MWSNTLNLVFVYLFIYINIFLRSVHFFVLFCFVLTSELEFYFVYVSHFEKFRKLILSKFHMEGKKGMRKLDSKEEAEKSQKKTRKRRKSKKIELKKKQQQSQKMQ